MYFILHKSLFYINPAWNLTMRVAVFDNLQVVCGLYELYTCEPCETREWRFTPFPVRCLLFSSDQESNIISRGIKVSLFSPRVEFAPERWLCPREQSLKEFRALSERTRICAIFSVTPRDW